jgi:hypothetical protein
MCSYVVRPVMVVAVLNMYTLFSLSLPKQYSITVTT